MSKNAFDGAYVVLSCCKTLLELTVFEKMDFFEEKCLSYNNLAVCLKNYGMYNIALKYMLLVLQFENYRDKMNYESVVLSEINICAILSQLNKHEEAISHAITAIKVLESADEQNMVSQLQSNQNLEEGSLMIKFNRLCEL